MREADDAAAADALLGPVHDVRRIRRATVGKFDQVTAQQRELLTVILIGRRKRRELAGDVQGRGPVGVLHRRARTRSEILGGVVREHLAEPRGRPLRRIRFLPVDFIAQPLERRRR